MRPTASSPGGPGSNPQLRTFGIGSDRMVAPGSSPHHTVDTERLASRPSGGAGVGGSGVGGLGGVGMSHSGSGQSVAAWIEEGLQDSYLSELLSYSLERLNKEPELLKAEAERVERQMQDVAVGHYRAFINAAEAVHTIRKEIADIDHHLGAMISEIPRLTSGCNEFLEEAHAVVEKRRTNRKMLANHPALLDLLEIPQLMDTCVRNGNYDEALDLEAFVSKLATMHAKLPVIQRLAQEVRQTTQAMLNQLLQRLRSNIQLPECLRIIGYLRRLAVFSEHDMRLQFLRCREAWLADVIAELDSSSPYEYIKRMTDCHRVQLFDVVTQYRAIFADDVASTSTALLDPSLGGAADDGLGGEAVVGGDGGLLYSWAMHRVSAFLRVLAEQVPRIADGGSLASVLDHCMYCGMSLGRVGLDIRGLLPPLFEVCVLRMFQRNMALAVQSFEHTLETHRWVPLPPLGVATRLSSSSDVEDVAPPYALMEHPPLAAFVNGILASLNELRHCAPLALRKPLAAALSTALADVSSSLVRYHHTRIAKESELALFVAMCKAFVEVVCPYVVTCFVRCMGSSSPVVGGPSAAAATVALVDVRSAADPIRKLITANLPPPLPLEEVTLEDEVVDTTGLENDSRRGASSGEDNSAEHASVGTAATSEAVLANGSEAAAAVTAAKAQR